MLYFQLQGDYTGINPSTAVVVLQTIIDEAGDSALEYSFQPANNGCVLALVKLSVNGQDSVLHGLGTDELEARKNAAIEMLKYIFDMSNWSIAREAVDPSD